jgi:hypothetical protein
MDPSVSDGEEEFMSGTYRCRDDIRSIVDTSTATDE